MLPDQSNHLHFDMRDIIKDNYRNINTSLHFSELGQEENNPSEGML